MTAPTLPALRALEERLVKATGPHVNLDGEIWGTLTGLETSWTSPWQHERVWGYWDDVERGGRHCFKVPGLTASIDAAIALCERMLPGWLWRVASCSVSDDAWVMPDFNHPEHGERFKSQFPEDAQRDPLAFFGTDIDQRPPGFPALALCKSIVRALIAQAEARI